jgi:hypothetical protein
LKKLRIHLSFLLLAALSLFITPKELLHAHSGHEDTTDVACHDACATHFENEHEHCDVLQLSSPPLYFSVSDFSFSFDKLVCNQPVENTGSYHSSVSAFLFFRGPPALII